MRFLKSYLKPIARARVLFVVAGEAVHLLPGLQVRFGSKESSPEAQRERILIQASSIYIYL